MWHFIVILQIYPGFYHKLLNEPKDDRTLVMSDIVSWINQRLPSGDADIPIEL